MFTTSVMLWTSSSYTKRLAIALTTCLILDEVNCDAALASDYNPRDSFEHSSTESAATSHTHTTHTGPSAATGGGPSNEEWRTPPAPVPPALQPPPRPFSLLRAFVPSFVFVWISLAVLTLLVFETDWAPLRPLKRKPELVSLRHHYYAPLKEYLRKKVIELFWFPPAVLLVVRYS